MKPQTSLFFVITVLLSAQAANAQVARVPSPVAEGAAFSEDQLVAEGPDGARLVVGGAAMITAVSGSKILAVSQPSPEALKIALGDGAFALHVGSKPVVFEIAGATVEAAGALMTVSDRLVKVDALFDGGKVEAKRMVEVPAPAPAQEEEAADAKKPKKKGGKKEEEPQLVPQRLEPPPMELRITALEAGKTYRLSAGAEPEQASADEKRRVEEIPARLAAKPKQVALKPAPIEDPKDIAGASDGAGDMELAEIEAVEVEIEADCVEICTD